MTPNNNIIIIGVSGIEGSFSEEAALRYAEQAHITPEIRYLTDMEGVLLALTKGNIDIGIFPVVNLHGGLVRPAFEAMGNYLFIPFDELWLDVKQCLLALPGTQFSQITKIISHQQALNQCKNYLKNNFTSAELIPWIDTAKAAQDLSNEKLTNTAVIAPERSAEIYHLDVIARNIQDINPNLTAFIITKRHG